MSRDLPGHSTKDEPDGAAMTSVPLRLKNLLLTASRKAQIVLRPVPFRAWLPYRSSKALKLLQKDEASARCMSCAASAHMPLQFMASEEELKMLKVNSTGDCFLLTCIILAYNIANIIAPASPHSIQGSVYSKKLSLSVYSIQTDIL